MLPNSSFFPHPGYRTLLGYPVGEEAIIAQRFACLQQLGITSLTQHGTTQLLNVPVLGYGYCGVVISGQHHGHLVAIKLRRLDCRQTDLRDEARLLLQANSVGIGPRLHAHSDDILVMEQLSGVPLATWLNVSRSGEELRSLLGQMVQQGYVLDCLGLDHGALRYPGEHVLIDNGRITLIDFSHASDQRRPNNVTSLVQGLLWGTRLAEMFQLGLDLPSQEELRPLLRAYKQQPEQGPFVALCQKLGIAADGSAAVGGCAVTGKQLSNSVHL
ncbi:RIO1 family regulatory kinase/ATPase [Desulfuromonas acetoxidans]|uniref:RIO1 family regulatory kinase/ATPase n=1 Tax=Desulfuromonas acetoxidans TaxID=891 RepID=UPI00292E0CC7|nr:RIO1 family regulatory kinase/ATPase [Desulfuromonas acetoxidans]